jgi:Holliday junction resolvase RusA-like endonuclease
MHKTTKPDVDKLMRAVFDALSGVVFEDDAQVVEGSFKKAFGSPARMDVRIETL